MGFGHDSLNYNIFLSFFARGFMGLEVEKSETPFEPEFGLREQTTAFDHHHTDALLAERIRLTSEDSDGLAEKVLVN